VLNSIVQNSLSEQTPSRVIELTRNYHFSHLFSVTFGGRAFQSSNEEFKEAKMAKIVIIGGGIGGLAAGCFARMNGFDPIILEKSSKLGGLCTS
jgi:ribulose 1,5-bisphosphate synthetase/thiazole synthase